MLEIKKLTDKNKQQYYPITHVDAVIGIDGRTIAEILDEDYATKGDVPTKTSDLTNDGDGSDSNSPFATQKYVSENGSKIDIVKVDGTPLEIDQTDKSVDIVGKLDSNFVKVNSKGVQVLYHVNDDGTFTTNDSNKRQLIDAEEGYYYKLEELSGGPHRVNFLTSSEYEAGGIVPLVDGYEANTIVLKRGYTYFITPIGTKYISIDCGDTHHFKIWKFDSKDLSEFALKNDLSDYATKEYVAEYGGKIDKITVDGTELPIVDKTVDIPSSSLTYALSKSGDTISLNGSDASVSSVYVENTTYGLGMRDNQIVLIGSNGSEEAVSYGELSFGEVYSGSTSGSTSIGKLISADVVVKSRMASVSYSQLVGLRNEGKLSPGLQYRITDYSTVVNQNYCSSAGHDFDIIVTANDERTLNENARAIRHSSGGTPSSGDTNGYFASSNLSAWELKYSLDNDSTKYGWASPNGKGVIYFMRDEHGNECPYDFKNVIYEFDVESPSGGGALRLSGYTFTSFEGSEWTVVDATVSGTRTISSTKENIPCHNNVVRTFSDMYDGCHYLNRICVYGMPSIVCYAETPQVVFDSGCHDIFIGGYNPSTENYDIITMIKVGCNSSSIILPRVSQHLNIGNSCFSMTQSSQGGRLSDLTIGDYGMLINFGLARFYSVEIGTDCYNITVSGSWSNLTLSGHNQSLNLRNSSNDYVRNVTIDKFISNKTIEPSTYNQTYETVYQAVDKQIITI